MVGADFQTTSAALQQRFSSHRKSFAESQSPRIDVAGGPRLNKQGLPPLFSLKEVLDRQHCLTIYKNKRT